MQVFEVSKLGHGNLHFYTGAFMQTFSYFQKMGDQENSGELSQRLLALGEDGIRRILDRAPQLADLLRSEVDLEQREAGDEREDDGQGTDDEYREEEDDDDDDYIEVEEALETIDPAVVREAIPINRRIDNCRCTGVSLKFISFQFSTWKLQVLSLCNFTL